MTTSRPHSFNWLQRMALASEFELSMSGFGLMGEPGSMAERLMSLDRTDNGGHAESPSPLAIKANAVACSAA